ncbi:MAG: dNTP triphosphohydrolase, partial [Micromonosporaceae bacterium]|nr:dNTP triphosphohydrolase [Micromonosporaceae bacterium]
MTSEREARMSQQDKKPKNDIRTAFRRDRDRLLYSSLFRRLGGVTQIAPTSQGQSFHNRLTHSIKVGHISRSIAENLLHNSENEAETTLRDSLDPDVAEFAGLAHDLGHPPFGHTAEEKLQKIISDDTDSFEGNAQTFRILTRLAVHEYDQPGLDLTQASLRSVLKYPWFYDREDEIRSKKWGVFKSDIDAFHFAINEEGSPLASLECQIMEWADDIAYAVHDLGRVFELDRFKFVFCGDGSRGYPCPVWVL